MMTERNADQADDGMPDPAARAVLDFWFGEPASPRFGQAWDRWFARDDAFDAALRERFGATLAAARRGECDAWQRTPLGALALIVVLDQFSRNIHRGSAGAFASDAQALEAAQRMVRTRVDRTLPSPYHRAFAYLPFEHDESRESQETALRLFGELADESRSDETAGYFDYARRHAAVIERFGRFPHRNAALGRESSDEERAFLRQPGSSF